MAILPVSLCVAHHNSMLMFSSHEVDAAISILQVTAGSSVDDERACLTSLLLAAKYKKAKKVGWGV